MGHQKPGGVALYCEGGATTEVHASKCQHCQHLTEFPSARRMLEFVDICRCCMGLVCLQCAGKPCTPAMKRIEAQEEAHYRRQQLCKMAGLE